MMGDGKIADNTMFKKDFSQEMQFCHYEC
ncbi:protein of unknown function [Serratia sp. Tan611]|nr:protein of unknown function [Serratia sp. Tan611]